MRGLGRILRAVTGWVLSRGLRPEDREFLRGDLEEEAAERRRQDPSGWRADLWYVRQALRATVQRSILGRPAAIGRGPRTLGSDWWSSLAQDVRYSCRMIGKQPGYGLVAVLILGLGIGGTVTMFTFVNGMLLEPLPYADGDRLMQLHEITPSGYRNTVSFPNFADWKRRTRTFDSMAAHYRVSLNFAAAEEPTRVSGLVATGELFRVLGVPPLHGRTFGPADDHNGAERVAVISHSLWTNQLGGRAGIVGDEIFLHGRPTVVVGIMPPGFHYPEYSHVWLPARVDPLDESRGAHYLEVVARLADGVTVEAAAAELATISRRIARENPESNGGWGAGLTTLREARVGDAGTALLVFTGVVLFVLLIATVNVSSLALARAAARRPEIAVRSAIGAARGRLVRQLVVEGLILAAGGGALGLLAGRWGRDLLLANVPVELPLWVDPSIEGFVVLVVALLSAGAGLVLGLVPATQIFRDLADALKHGAGRPGGAPRQRLRGGLVVAQVALASILLIGAGLMMKGFVSVQQVETGLDIEGVISFRVSLPSAQYGEAPERLDFYRQLVDRLGALPGVEAAGAISGLPLWGSASTLPFYPEGMTPRPDDGVRSVVHNVVRGDYLKTLEIPVLEGRPLTVTDDRPGARPVALVSRTYADRHWPQGDAIGKRIRSWDGEQVGPWLEIVGVVAEVRHFGPAADPRPGVYVPLVQQPRHSMFLTVRSGGPDPLDLVEPVRAVVGELDPRLPVQGVTTMQEVWRNSMWEAIVYSWLFAVFSGIALVLAATGLYGLLAYSVGRRRHEIGVRMALGARGRELLGLVLRQALRLVAVGVVIGLVGAFLLSGAIASLIHGVSATDPTVYLAVALAVLAVAAIAAAVPGRRATRIDPREALRSE